jgi:hypothetical protein
MTAGFIGFRPTVTAGTGGVAPGAWNLREVFNQRRANLWPEHTPDTPAAVDSLWGAVRLLVPFETSANSVTHSDGQSITGTTSGTSGSPASAVTGDYKYGSGGWTHYQGTVTYSTGTFNSTNWTVEFWFKRNTDYSFTNNRQVMKFGDFTFKHVSANNFVLYDDDDESSIGSFGTAVSGTWEHYAIVYQNGTMRLYKGGVQVASSAGTLSAPSSVVIGRSSNPLYNFSLDELRVTDASRYPSGTSFSVPPAAHGTSSGTGKLDVNNDASVRFYLPASQTTFKVSANTSTGYYKLSSPGKTDVIGLEYMYTAPTYYAGINGGTTPVESITMSGLSSSAVKTVTLTSCTSNGTASGGLLGVDIGNETTNNVTAVDVSGCTSLLVFHAGAAGVSGINSQKFWSGGGPAGIRRMASSIEEVRAVNCDFNSTNGYTNPYGNTIYPNAYGWDVAGHDMDATALNQLYTDLAAGTGGGGLFVGGNPGVSSDNPSIASNYSIHGSS